MKGMFRYHITNLFSHNMGPLRQIGILETDLSHLSLYGREENSVILVNKVTFIPSAL